MEIERNCMRCKKEVSIDFQESVSLSGKPILIGKCPDCDGVNLQQIPYKNSEGTSSKVENPDQEMNPTEPISELSTGNPDSDLESSDNPMEDSEHSPSQVEPSESSLESGDIIQVYHQGYEDGREDMSSDTTKESEGNDQDTVTPEGESDQIVDTDQDDTEESEEESDNTEKGSGLHIFMVVLTVISIATIVIMVLTARDG